MQLRLMAVEKKLLPLEQRTRSMKQRRLRTKLRNKKERLERRTELHIRNCLDEQAQAQASLEGYARLVSKGLSLALLSDLCMLGCLNSYTWLEACVDRVAAVILVAMVIEMLIRIFRAGHHSTANGEQK